MNHRLSNAYKNEDWLLGMSFPISEQMSNEILSLPICPHINIKDVSLVVKSLQKSI